MKILFIDRMRMTVEEAARAVGGAVVGDGAVPLEGLAPLEGAAPGTLVFIDRAGLLAAAEASPAAAVLVPKNVPASRKPLIQVANPRLAFGILLARAHPPKAYPPGVHPTAVVGKEAALGKGVHVGPHAVLGERCAVGEGTAILAGAAVGDGVRIGRECCLYPNVVLYDGVVLGDRVVIHAGTVIGSDGFGYVPEGGRHLKIPHAGNVVIEDDVEIGAQAAVDRAVLGSTVIGKGTKIDNLVQVAHNVRLGAHNILCAFAGIAGTSRTGDHVTLAAGAGVSDHAEIGAGALLGARSGVPPGKKIPAGGRFFGEPAREEKRMKRQFGALLRLPDLLEEIRNLRRRVGELEKIADRGR